MKEPVQLNLTNQTDTLVTKAADCDQENSNKEITGISNHILFIPHNINPWPQNDVTL